MRHLSSSLFVSVAIATALLVVVPGAGAQSYIDAGEIAAISGVTGGAFALGLHIKHFDSTATVFWVEPSGFERRMQRLLGGSHYRGKTNFLDSDFGAAVTPITAAMLITAANLAYPQGKKEKDALQDGFLFGSGILATKAVTDITKGVFRRRRPAVAMGSSEMPLRTDSRYYYNHRSFVSGHSSSAFFSMVFLNARTRSIMRSEMSPAEYRSWRWLPPTVCFSWATFVGWSRIHAYKHYVTDVMAGALVGWLMGELFLSFGDYDDRTTADPANGTGTLLRFTITF